MPRRRKSVFKDPDFEGRRRGRRASRREDLTDELIAAESIAATERTIHDLEVRGLYVRIRPCGSKSFAYRQPATRTKNPVWLGNAETMSIANARIAAQRQRDDREAGRIVRPTSGSHLRLTVARAFELYQNSLSPTEWSRRITRTFERLILPKVGNIKISELDADTARRTVGTVGGYYQAATPHYILSAFLTWNVRRGHIPFNVLAGRASLPRRPIPRAYPLGADAIGRFWRACEDIPEKWGIAFRLMIASGRSIHEILSISLSEVANGWPQDDGMWPGRRGAMITELVLALQRPNGRHSFVSRGKKTPMVFQQRYWNMVRTAAGHEHATMRDIRKSANDKFAACSGEPTEWDDFLRSCMADSNNVDEVDL